MTQDSRLRAWLDELGRYRTVALDTSVVIYYAQRYNCDALIGNDAQMIGHDFGLAYLHLDNYIS